MFHRHARGVRLSREGSTVVEYGNQILQLLQQLRGEVLGASAARSVRIGLSEDYAIGRLPRLLRDFGEAWPSLDLQLFVDQSTQLNRFFANDVIDIAIAVPELMSAEPILRWSVPLVWVASHDYAVEPSKPLSLVTTIRAPSAPDILPHPWDQKVRDQLERSGLHWRVVCSTSTVATMLAAVEAGLGIGHFTQASIRPTLRVLTELDGMPPPTVVDFGIFVRGDEISSHFAPLIDLLTKHIVTRP
jgi:DNA-binding transcriptional LysR family regulator